VLIPLLKSSNDYFMGLLISRGGLGESHRCPLSLRDTCLFFLGFVVCRSMPFLDIVHGFLVLSPLHFSIYFPFYVVMMLVASQYHGWVLPLVPDLWQKLVGRFMLTLTKPTVGNYEVNGEVGMDNLLVYMLLLLIPGMSERL
jgi:hypothetical protein